MKTIQKVYQTKGSENRKKYRTELKENLKKLKYLRRENIGRFIRDEQNESRKNFFKTKCKIRISEKKKKKKVKNYKFDEKSGNKN